MTRLAAVCDECLVGFVPLCSRLIQREFGVRVRNQSVLHTRVEEENVVRGQRSEVRVVGDQ